MTPLYKFLGYAGALPFIFCAIVMLLFGAEPGSLFLTVQIVYAGLILAFLSGVHWAHAFRRESEDQMLGAMILPILSLFLVPLGISETATRWFGDGMGVVIVSFCLFLFMLGFIFLYFFDLQSLDKSELPEGYMRFRLSMTTLVCVSLCVSILALWA